MKLVLGSDLHGLLPKVPECDVLILAGDILPEKDQAEFIENKLKSWLLRAPAGDIVATWGNHDFKPFKHDFSLIPLPWTLLIDKSATVQGLKFHGTPWCLPIGRWAWQAPEYLLEHIYSLIPDDVDILISHAPPYGLGDRVQDGELAGSKSLLERMKSLSNLKFLVCGHIHEARGRYGKVVNVSSIDHKYIPYPNPWTIVEL